MQIRHRLSSRYQPILGEYHPLTRMHSSRMHTVCCSGRLGGGGMCPGGVCQGGCVQGGVQGASRRCVCPGCMCVWGQGGVSRGLVQGCMSRVCVCVFRRGVCPGGFVSQHAVGQTPPSLWTAFLTHTCENITFPQLLLRTVITSAFKFQHGLLRFFSFN